MSLSIFIDTHWLRRSPVGALLHERGGGQGLLSRGSELFLVLLNYATKIPRHP